MKMCPARFLPDRRQAHAALHQPPAGRRYYLGDWKNEQFHPTFHEKMSWVDNSFFAPESLLDEQGRRIMWAWIFDGPGFATRQAFGWSGTMSLPRMLSLGPDGLLRMDVPEEVERLRYHARNQSNLAVPADQEIAMDGLGGNSIELSLEMNGPEARQYGVKVCRSPQRRGGDTGLLRRNREETESGYEPIKPGRRAEEH